MQTFTYAGVTICYERLHNGAVPIGIGVQAGGGLVLVCRYPEAAEGDLLSLGEVQECWDCHTLQRQDEPDKTCLKCGGTLDWAEVQHLNMGA